MADRVYPPVIATARAVFATLGLRFLESGTENVPTSGGAVLAANHVSYLDFIFAGLAALPSHRLVRFMAKESIFKHPIAGPLMRGMHHIPVDRDAGASSYVAALRALKAGEVVGVFPEATISRAFELKEFKSGAIRLAMSSGVPLVPTITWGGQRIMTKGHPRDFHRGKTVSLTVGEPLHPSRRDDPDEVSAELHARMSALLERTIADYPDKPKDDDDRWWIPARYGGTALTLEEAEAMEEKH